MTAFFLIILVALAAIGFAVGNGTAGAAQASGIAGLFPGLVTNTGAVNLTGVSGPNSDSSLTGSPITNDPSTWPGAMNGYSNGNIWNVCAAVALAEGYNQGPGAAPYDLNNPGDLSPGDESGQATAGPPQSHGGSSIIFFETAEGGFVALYDKFLRIVTSNSTVYPVTATWAQVAATYAGNSSAWLNNVTSYLGVDPSSTPAQYAQTV
jgi:hypothetical protein